MQSRSQERWLWSMLSAMVFLIATADVCHWLKVTEHQRRANATEWRWSEEQATFDYCVKNNLHGYTIRTKSLEPAWPDSFRCFQISVMDGDEEACTFTGN